MWQNFYRQRGTFDGVLTTSNVTSYGSSESFCGRTTNKLPKHEKSIQQTHLSLFPLMSRTYQRKANQTKLIIFCPNYHRIFLLSLGSPGHFSAFLRDRLI